MIRVLQIVGKMDRGGAETMVMNLFRNIEKNIKFDFIVFSNSPGDYDEEIIKLGGRIIPILSTNPLMRSFLLLKFLKSNREYRIVHSHTLLSSGFHLLAAKIAGVKNRITHSHSTGYKSGFLSSLYRKLTLFLIDRYTTHAISCGALASKFLFPNRSDVKIISNGVDTTLLADLESQDKYLSNLFEVSGLNLIQVGRLEKVKNHKFSIEFASYLKDKGWDFTLFFVGKGSLLNSINEEIEKRNLTDKVKVLGLRDDIPELMASCDFMIMPSLYEGFPVVLVEAQAVGLKTLASDRVSYEVDLGLNLVKFVPLESEYAHWESEMNKWRHEQTASKIERLFSLDNNGFNVVENAKELAKFYNLIQNV